MNQPANATTTKPKVGVSYAWEAENDGVNKDQVEGFCAALTEAGADVIRDKDRVQFNDSLTEFARQLAECETLYVFLSEAYLQSHWCVGELVLAWDGSLADSARFRQRVHVWVMPGFVLDESSRERFVGYWEEKSTDLEGTLKGKDPANRPELLKSYNKWKSFPSKLDSILALIADQRHYRAASEFLQHVATLTATKHSESRLAASASHPSPVLPNYRAKVIEAMEDMLSRSELRSLVAKLVRVQKFGRMTEDRFVFSSELRAGPEAVYHVLLGIEESLEDGPLKGTLKPAERTTLDVIVGGVVLLGMSPGWMANQFQEHRTGKAVRIPSDDGAVTVDEEKGISADVLALVSAAFFERRANLDGLLGRICRRGVAASADMGLGDVLQGVGEEDIYFELKRHLVAVLHPKKEARAKAGRLPAKTKSSDIEIWFKQLIGYVNRWYDKGTPRYLSHDSYAAHLPRIRELGLDKLLFLIPVKGDFDAAFERHVEVLMTSWELHKRLSK